MWLLHGKGCGVVNREEILQYLDFKIVECSLMRDSSGGERAAVRLDIYQDIRLVVFGKKMSQEAMDNYEAKASRISAELEEHDDEDGTQDEDNTS